MSRHFLATAFYTSIAMLAFSANAIICRWTLEQQLIDPISFSAFRLFAGAAMLFVVMTGLTWYAKADSAVDRPALKSKSKERWISSFYLFIYAISFSYGYVAVDTASGALILASVVQYTMIAHALAKGDKLHAVEWFGLAVALVGLAYLMYPKLTSPSWWGVLMVALSAYSWALYCLKGRNSSAPLHDTAFNFYYTLPMVLLLMVVTFYFTEHLVWTTSGVLMAFFSGAVTSGLGYIVWYKALPRLSSSIASTCQLSVPLIAAYAASLLIGESITLHFLLSALLLLGGLALVIVGQNQSRKKTLLALEKNL